MAWETFTPPTWVNAAPGTGIEEAPRVRVAEFGGAYRQRTADSINPITSMMNVVFTVLTHAEGEEIRQFFRSKGGYIPFLWALPGEETPTQWVATKWTKVWDTGVSLTVTATLEQDFTPEEA